MRISVRLVRLPQTVIIRTIVLFNAALLICLASTAKVQASIIAPPFADTIGDEEILSFVEESKASSAGASSSQTSRPASLPSPFLPKVSSIFMLVMSSGMLAGGNGAGMTGSSVSSPGGGNIAVVISTGKFSLADSALVVWLSRSDWLAIPEPLGGSLLRPPQTARS
jgi:hypothetical protein